MVGRLTFVLVLMASLGRAQTPFLKMGPVTDGATEGALERIDGCLGGIAQKTVGANWLCMPGDGPPTDTPLTCSAGLQGTRYFDLSMTQPCICDGTNWCTVSGGVCGSPTSCGTTPAVAAAAACPGNVMYWIPSMTISGGGVATVTPGDGTTVGRGICMRFTLPCTLTFTQMAARVATTSASQQFDVGILSYDGTTVLAHLGADSTKIDLGSGGNHVATVPSTTLQAKTSYSLCSASSETTSTGKLQGATADGTLGVAFAGSNNTYIRGATAAANVAQFNANCTSAGAPYACCTGSTTGTCVGFVAGLGTLNIGANSGSFPWVVVQ